LATRSRPTAAHVARGRDDVPSEGMAPQGDGGSHAAGSPTSPPDATSDASRPLDRAGAWQAPGWLAGAAALGWRALAIAGLAYVVVTVATWLSTPVLAVLVAAVVAATVSPVARSLRGRPGWTRTRAAALTSLLALAILLLTALLVLVAFVPYFDDVVRAGQAGTDAAMEALARTGVPAPVVDTARSVTNDLQTSVPDIARSMVGPVSTVVTVLILAAFLTFYLLQDFDVAWLGGTSRLDAWRARTLNDRAESAVGEVGGYLRGIAITAATSAISQFLYLTVLGVPFAGPLAVLVLVGGFVPYLGPIFTTVTLLLVTFAARGQTEALVLLGLITLTSLAQSRLLTPRAYAGATRVHPALVLVAAPAGAALFGLAGLLLAVPVVAAATSFSPAVIQVLGSGPGSGDRFVPAWLERLADLSWRALVVVAVVAVAAQSFVAPVLTAPVVVALVVACAAKPASDALRRRGLGRTPAALGVTVAAGAVVATILVVTVESLATELPAILDEAAQGAERLVGGDAIAQLLAVVQTALGGASRELLGNIASISVALVTSGLLTFFFLRDGPGWWAALLRRIPADRRELVGDSGSTAARILNGSTLGTGVVSAVAAVLQVVMLTVLHLPLAVPIGVLTFIGGFIPYVGNFVASALAFLVAVAAGNPTTVVVMAIWTVVNNILIGNVVAPLVVGRTVRVHPAVVLLAAPVGASIGGLVGMFLIVPAIAIFGATWPSLVRLLTPPSAAIRRPEA